MVNWKLIAKILGSLLFIEAFIMSWCLIMALVFGEDDVMAFIFSTILTFGSAFIFLYFGRDAENALGRRDAYVVVTATWVVFSFFGMFPFLIHGSLTRRCRGLRLQVLRLSTMSRPCHTAFFSGVRSCSG